MSKYLIIMLYDFEGTHVSDYRVQHLTVDFQNQGELEEWIDKNVQILAKDEDWSNLNQVMLGHNEYTIESKQEAGVIKNIRIAKSVLKYYHPVLGKDFDFTVDFCDREPAFRILGYVQKEQ